MRLSWRVQSLLLAALLTCCWWQSVNSHALMIHPQSRNFQSYLEESNYNPHGLNAGGTRTIAGDGKLSWPNIRLESLCGGAPGWDSRWDTPGPVGHAIYVKGQVIDIDVLVAVNHLGRFEFKLCSIAARPGDAPNCHQLQRADGKGTYFYLPFVKNWSGGNSGYDQPAYGDGSFSWYTLPSLGFEQGCRRQLTCDQFVGMVVYRTKWRLPGNVTCQHCKLQWKYMTAHSCWPPCPAANADEPTCKNVQVYPECGQPGTSYPEHFLNCADVRVVDGPHARPPGLRETPVWEPQVSLHVGKLGTPAAYRMFESEPVQWSGGPTNGALNPGPADSQLNSTSSNPSPPGTAPNAETTMPSPPSMGATGPAAPFIHI